MADEATRTSTNAAESEMEIKEEAAKQEALKRMPQQPSRSCSLQAAQTIPAFKEDEEGESLVMGQHGFRFPVDRFPFFTSKIARFSISKKVEKQEPAVPKGHP